MKRITMKLALAVGALAFVGACADSPTAPAAADPTQIEIYADQIAPTAVPDLTDFRALSGQLWVCATGHPVGNDFHYAFTVREKVGGALVAKGMIHNVSIGQCVLAAQMPTDVRGHYVARVKQDAPLTFYMAHGFFDFGAGFPATFPPSTVDLPTRTMTSELSNDGGVVMNFYNLLRMPPS